MLKYILCLFFVSLTAHSSDFAKFEKIKNSLTESYQKELYLLVVSTVPISQLEQVIPIIPTIKNEFAAISFKNLLSEMQTDDLIIFSYLPTERHVEFLEKTLRHKLFTIYVDREKIFKIFSDLKTDQEFEIFETVLKSHFLSQLTAKNLKYAFRFNEGQLEILRLLVKLDWFSVDDAILIARDITSKSFPLIHFMLTNPDFRDNLSNEISLRFTEINEDPAQGVVSFFYVRRSNNYPLKAVNLLLDLGIYDRLSLKYAAQTKHKYSYAALKEFLPRRNNFTYGSLSDALLIIKEINNIQLPAFRALLKTKKEFSLGELSDLSRLNETYETQVFKLSLTPEDSELKYAIRNKWAYQAYSILKDLPFSSKRELENSLRQIENQQTYEMLQKNYKNTVLTSTPLTSEVFAETFLKPQIVKSNTQNTAIWTFKPGKKHEDKAVEVVRAYHLGDEAQLLKTIKHSGDLQRLGGSLIEKAKLSPLLRYAIIEIAFKELSWLERQFSSAVQNRKRFLLQFIEVFYLSPNEELEVEKLVHLKRIEMPSAHPYRDQVRKKYLMEENQDILTLLREYTRDSEHMELAKLIIKTTEDLKKHNCETTLTSTK